jgi:hypothetical protein
MRDSLQFQPLQAGSPPEAPYNQQDDADGPKSFTGIRIQQAGKACMGEAIPGRIILISQWFHVASLSIHVSHLPEISAPAPADPNAESLMNAEGSGWPRRGFPIRSMEGYGLISEE